MNKICKYCKNFIKGTEKHTNHLTPIASQTKKVPKCKKTYYKITENTFCIIPKEFKSKF